MAIKTTSTTCCAPVLTGRLGAESAAELATLFRALGDPGRLRLLSFLAAQPGGEACVCNLTEPLGLSQPTVSHHLKVLADAGLLGRAPRNLDLLPPSVGTPATTLQRARAAEALDRRDGAARGEVGMTSIRIQPVKSVSAWIGCEIASRRDWVHVLSTAEIEDLDRAVAHARSTGKPLGELTRDDFPLGLLARS